MKACAVVVEREAEVVLVSVKAQVAKLGVKERQQEQQGPRWRMWRLRRRWQS